MTDAEVLRLLSSNSRKATESINEYFSRLIEGLREASFSLDPASEIARNDSEWMSWATSAGVFSPTSLSPEAAGIQRDLRLVRERVKYPGRLRDLVSLNKPEYREEEFFVRDIVKWSETVADDAWDDTIPPDVLKLFMSWLVTRRALDTKPYELAQRTLADALVQAVFSERLSDEAPHTTHMEQDILIPVKPEAQFQLSKAKADICTSRTLPEPMTTKIRQAIVQDTGRLKHVAGLHFLGNAIMTPVVSLGTLFGDWKREASITTSARQGTIYGLGMQTQRRALGFPDRSIYGLSLVNGRLHLLITYWQGAILTVHYTEGDMTWDLRQPSKLVECFYFLCTLKAQIDDDFTADVDKMTENAGFINWELAGTRVDNWETSNISRASARRSKQAKNKARDPRQSENEGSKSKLSDGAPAKKRPRDDDDEMLSSDETSDDDDDDDESCVVRNHPDDPVARERENLECASIINWQFGKTNWVVSDLEAWRRAEDNPLRLHWKIDLPDNVPSHSDP